LSARKLPPIIEAVRRLAGGKPILFAMLGEDALVPPDLIAQLRDLGVPFFRSPERALRALARFTEIGARRACVRSLAQAPAAAPRLPPGVIPEYAAKRLLAEAGVRMPPGVFVTTLSEAIEAAGRIGWPVALKGQSCALSHKSDAGAVVLGVSDKTSLESAWAALTTAVSRAAPGLTLEGVLVEKMAEPGAELILGARRDPDWGPVLALGLGGVFAELLHDVRLLPADSDVAAIAAQLGALRGAALLRGFRGSPPRDIEAAARIAQALGRFVLAHPEIAEIEINPLVVHESGRGASALDALIVVR
jgi:acyl-CoA synthetase (NDP forming)